MSYEKMELSPKVDLDLNDTSLSFISALSCKDDDSVLLPDSMNSEGCSQMDAGDLLKSGIMDSAQDLFNLNSLSSEPSDGLINALADGTDFSMNDSSLNPISSSVQSTPAVNFITASPAKTIEWPTTAKLINANKPGQPQLLILQKPNANLLAGAKTVPVVSSSNVAIVQTSTGTTSGTRYLTLPSLSASGNILSLNTSGSSSGKSNDVKILLNQVPTSTPTFVMAKPVSSTGNTLQVPLKRAVTPSSSGQMVTKVIITNNTASNSSMVTPVPVSASVTSTGASGQPQSILLASPNKTYTVSRNNIFNLNNSHQMLKPILGTPAKQYVLSPVRPFQKTAGFAPATYARSPRRIAPATVSVSQISTLNTGGKLTTIMCPTSVMGSSAAKISLSQSTGCCSFSPTKVILKPASQTLLKPLMSASNTNSTTTTFTSAPCSSVATATISQPSSTGSTQSIQVPGSKFHYVRLVSAPATSATTVTGRKEATILPVSSSTSLSSNVITVNTTSISSALGQIRPTVPIAPAKLVAPKQTAPKFLMPSVSGTQIRGTSSLTTAQLGTLSGGTFIPVGGGNSSYVMLPAQYLQLQQSSASQSSSGPTQMLNILPAPATSAQSSTSQSAFISLSSNPPNNFRSSAGPAAHHSPRRVTPVETDNRQRKPCNCTKSQCLKLYCDCFANGEFCNNCNCNNCYNNLAHEEERQKAIKACLDRNPLAFHPKIGKSREGGDQERRHTKGCNCKRSYCLKNYCECYEAKILCTSICKCIGCKNFEDSSERKTLMHLADAAEVRVQQQAAAKTNFSSDIFDFPTRPPVMSRSGERLPFAFVTEGVLEATCLCLLAHASDAEKSHTSEEEIERIVLEEFGRCLVRIIDCANKTKVSKMDIQ